MAAISAFLGSAYAGAPAYGPERAAMVAKLRGRHVTNSRVLAAMGKVPRHMFTSEALRRRAYEDVELPIGNGEVMPSPYVVAVMAQVLDPRPGARILEVGTGSGYLSAVLSQITSDVYTIDMRPEIARAAQARLKGYRVTARAGSACRGWPERGPFDGIVVNCAVEQVPEPLIAQLRDGGRLVIPIGHGPEQTLNCLRKSGRRLRSETIMAIRMSPMACHGPR